MNESGFCMGKSVFTALVMKYADFRSIRVKGILLRGYKTMFLENGIREICKLCAVYRRDIFALTQNLNLQINF